MQGQRSNVESFPETFEFDHGSATSNPGMERQVYWNNLLLNPVETQSLEDYKLSHSDTNMSHANATSQESATLSLWNSGEPSSSEQPQNLDNCDETKIGHLWTASITGNGGGGLRIEEREFEATNMLSLESVRININNHHSGNSLPFSQNPNSIDLPLNFGENVGYVGASSQAPEAGLFPPNSSLLEADHVLSSGGSSNACENSSRGIGIFSEEGEGRPGGSLDGWRLYGKRKTIGGVPEQASASASASSNFFCQSENSSIYPISSHYNHNTSLNISRSSETLSGLSPAAQLNSRIGTTTGVVVSDSGNAESSRRNIRMRINSAHQYDTVPHNLLAPGNTTTLPNVWSTNQPFSLPIPFTQSLESRPVVAGASSQSQLHRRVITRLHRNVQLQNGASSSRLGSSQSNPIVLGERLTASREVTNSRSMMRNIASDHSVLVPASDIRQSVPVPPYLVLPNVSADIPGNVPPTSLTGLSSGVQSLGPTMLPHQNPPGQYHQRFAEAVRQLLSSVGNSPSGGQGDNVAPHPQRSVQPAASQDIGRPSGAGLRGHPLSYMRSRLMVDRQRDGVPVSMRTSAAAREGRSRMISEHIRNALDLMRRGENLRLEDIFDHSVFYGGADLFDRHRDMRLDVDNMSYEELLALEERIGNVSTGLSEETVLKCLKQRKYTSVTVEAFAEAKPCCICQEEYTDGEELGALDCGHDFHTACIKQWLLQKNLCPTCKTTALATT